MGLIEEAQKEIEIQRLKALKLVEDRGRECAVADKLCLRFRLAWLGDDADPDPTNEMTTYTGDFVPRRFYTSFPTGLGTVDCPYVSADGFDSFYEAVPLLEAAEDLLGPVDKVSDYLAVARTRRFVWNDEEGRARFMVMIGLSSEARCEVVQVGSEPVHELRCG